VKNKGYFVMAVIILSAISCEREAKNVTLPEFGHKLVVTSFISPYDSVSFVTVESNERLYGDLSNMEPLGDISVNISDGSKRIALEKGDYYFFFRRKYMAVQEGKKYTLEVSAANGLKADAECTVPLSRDLNISADTTRIYSTDPDGGKWSELKIKVYLEDPAGEKNYYRFAAKQMDYNPLYGGYPIIWDLDIEEKLWFSDEGYDGKRIYANSARCPSFSNVSDSVKVVIYILNTNEDYFLYHKSLEEYSGGDGPFSEASPVFSNINGGIGIFAGYTVDSLVFRLK
jgi:hypothetical protein